MAVYDNYDDYLYATYGVRRRPGYHPERGEVTDGSAPMPTERWDAAHPEQITPPAPAPAPTPSWGAPPMPALQQEARERASYGGDTSETDPAYLSNRAAAIKRMASAQRQVPLADLINPPKGRVVKGLEADQTNLRPIAPPQKIDQNPADQRSEYGLPLVYQQRTDEAPRVAAQGLAERLTETRMAAPYSAITAPGFLSDEHQKTFRIGASATINLATGLASPQNLAMMAAGTVLPELVMPYMAYEGARAAGRAGQIVGGWPGGRAPAVAAYNKLTGEYYTPPDNDVSGQTMGEALRDIAQGHHETTPDPRGYGQLLDVGAGAKGSELAGELAGAAMAGQWAGHLATKITERPYFNAAREAEIRANTQGPRVPPEGIGSWVSKEPTDLVHVPTPLERGTELPAPAIHPALPRAPLSGAIPMGDGSVPPGGFPAVEGAAGAPPRLSAGTPPTPLGPPIPTGTGAVPQLGRGASTIPPITRPTFIKPPTELEATDAEVRRYREVRDQQQRPTPAAMDVPGEPRPHESAESAANRIRARFQAEQAAAEPVAPPASPTRKGMVDPRLLVPFATSAAGGAIGASLPGSEKEKAEYALAGAGLGLVASGAGMDRLARARANLEGGIGGRRTGAAGDLTKLEGPKEGPAELRSAGLSRAEALALAEEMHAKDPTADTVPWNGLPESMKAGMADEIQRQSREGAGIGNRLYSRLASAINGAPHEKATGEQWAAALAKNVNASERSWTGIDDYLTENKGKVLTRQQVADVFNKGRIQIGETRYGDNPDAKLERSGRGVDVTRAHIAALKAELENTPDTERQSKILRDIQYMNDWIAGDHTDDLPRQNHPLRDVANEKMDALEAEMAPRIGRGEWREVEQAIWGGETVGHVLKFLQPEERGPYMMRLVSEASRAVENINAVDATSFSQKSPTAQWEPYTVPGDKEAYGERVATFKGRRSQLKAPTYKDVNRSLETAQAAESALQVLLHRELGPEIERKYTEANPPRDQGEVLETRFRLERNLEDATYDLGREILPSPARDAARVRQLDARFALDAFLAAHGPTSWGEISGAGHATRSIHSLIDSSKNLPPEELIRTELIREHLGDATVSDALQRAMAEHHNAVQQARDIADRYQHERGGENFASWARRNRPDWTSKQVSAAFKDKQGAEYQAWDQSTGPTASKMGEPFKVRAHWGDTENPLTHMRFSVRLRPDGEAILVPDETQSDLHEQGRNRGYRGDPITWPDQFRKWAITQGLGEYTIETTIEDGISGKENSHLTEFSKKTGTRLINDPASLERPPRAPMAKTQEWAELGVKQMIDEAVRRGIKYIVLPTGDQVAKYFRPMDVVDRLEYNDETQRLVGKKNGKVVYDKQHPPADVIEALGKEVGQRLLNEPIREGAGREELARLQEKRDNLEVKYQRLKTEFYRLFGQSSEGHEGAQLQVSNAHLDLVEARRAFDRAAENAHDGRMIEGRDLKISSVPFRKFYEKMMHSVIKDYAKKMGVDLKIEPAEMPDQHPMGAELTEDEVGMIGGDTRVAAREAGIDESVGYSIAHIESNMRQLSATWREAVEELLGTEDWRSKQDPSHKSRRASLLEASKILEAAEREKAGSEADIHPNMGFRLPDALAEKVKKYGQPLMGLAAMVGGTALAKMLGKTDEEKSAYAEAMLSAAVVGVPMLKGKGHAIAKDVSHTLDAERGARVFGKRVVLSDKEHLAAAASVAKVLEQEGQRLEAMAGPPPKGTEAAAAFAKEQAKKLEKIGRQTVRDVYAAIKETKAAHPAKDGWATPVYKGAKVVSLTSEKTGKITIKVEHEWENQPYHFNHVNGKALKLGTPEYDARVAGLAARVHDEVIDVVRRANAGDKIAQQIVRQAGWYRNMRERLRHEFGGLGDIFADLLGATSPNTPVRLNHKFAIDVLQRATRGDFDTLIPEWERRVDTLAAKEQAAKLWVQEQRAAGRTLGSLHKTPEWSAMHEELKSLRELPPELQPKSGEGKLYGFNGLNVMRALVDLWRTVREPDTEIKKGAQAPKALNFSGNLIGFRERATIDVWAARLLNRLAGEKRIPSVAETTVGGTMLPDGSTTGAFRFGQDVLTDAAEKIRGNPAVANHPVLKELGDDDLQALAWFIEKETWTKNNWTSKAGEGGSFEFEHDVLGSQSQGRIEELRTILDAQATKPEERVRARAELEGLKRTVDRYTAGLSMSRDGFVPTDADQARMSDRLRTAIATHDPEARVIASKVFSTEGRYGTSNERALDLEAVTREGYDPTPLWKEIVQAAKDEKQETTFLSRVLREGEAVNPDVHRPGLEVYFRQPAEMAKLEPILREIMASLNKKGISGFTLSVDARSSAEAKAGAVPKVVGLRVQYIPEYERLSQTKEGRGLTTGKLAPKIEGKAQVLRDLGEELRRRIPEVSLAKQVWHDTRVAFSHEYDGEINGNVHPAGTAGAGAEGAPAEAWQGRSIREGLTAADRQHRLSSGGAGGGGAPPAGSEGGTVYSGDAKPNGRVSKPRKGFASSPVIGAIGGAVLGGAAGAAFGNTDEEKQAYAAAGLMGGMLLGGAAMAAASKPRAAAPRPKWAGIELPEEGGIGRSNYAPRKFEFLDPLRQIFNPMGLSGHAEATGGTIRAGGARGARYLANARRVLGTMEARVQSLPLDQQVEVRNAADQWLASGAHLRPGQAAPAMPAGLRAQMAAIDPALPSMLDAFKEITDQYTRKLVEMGILEHTLDDYVGRSWMQAAELGGFEQGGGGAGKSKIEGSKTYTKARQRNEDGTLKYQTFGDGIKAGLTPRTYNLVTEQLHKFADMQRAIDGRLMMDTEVAAGRAKQVSQEDITKGNIPTDPDGKPWKPIGSLNDPAYTQKRVTPDGFLETKGRYYAPQDVAAVWNNHLARGLKGSRVYQMLATPGRAMAQTILGISGFHGVTTMTNGVFSELALGVDAAVNRGDLRRAAGSVGAALKSPRVDYKYGQQLVEQFADPSAHPDLEPVVRLMVEGGWRGDGANEFWKGDRKAAFQKSWKQAFEGVRWQDRAKGAIESPIQKMFQGVEWASRPIMEKYVPRMKAAALAMEISRRMEALPPDATVEQIRAVTGRAMTEMDARFGQVIYDNHFINKSVKDAMQLVMLAPGWTFGNINLMTRSAQNIKAIGLGALKGKRVPTNSATNFWIASFVGTAVTNAILTKVNNPDEPIMLQDLLAWRDGSKDKEGNWNRHTLPGYLMHDVYNYVHKSVDTHGVHPFEQAKATSKTMVNKLSPALRMTIGLLTNSDYAGNQIYGDLDSAPELLAHVGKYMAKGVLPISIASGIEGHNRGEGLGSYVAGAAGMSPAPREFVRTEAQNALADIARRNQGSSSPEESDHFQMMMKAHTIAENQGKDAADAYLHDLQDRGMVTPAQLRSAMKVDTKNPLAQKFAKSRGTVSDLEKVFNLGTPEEQALWAPLLRAKAARAGRQDILRRIEPSVPPE